MAEGKSRVYGYRWLLLAAFMLAVFMNQALWITFAPITSVAAQAYATSDLMIALLSLCFMVVYIVLVLPAAWLIDTWGLRWSVTVGAALSGVFALTRGIFASSFTLVLVSQIGIAVGQPLILGAMTKLAARWFRPEERATATGLGTLAIYLGVLASLIVTPVLVDRFGLQGMLLDCGAAGVLAAVIFALLGRERPRTPASADSDDRTRMFDGLKSMMRNPDFLRLLVIFFVGLGMFNGISTWIEDIVRPRGFTTAQAGLAGGVMLGGGIVGAVVLPLLSDGSRRRKPFVILALAALLPGLVGLTLAAQPWLLYASAALFGFFLLSAGPIGFQYGAEITVPAPEGTSNSMLLVMGQVSGIAFILLMDAVRGPDGAMTPSLLGFVVLTAICLILSLFLGESPIRDSRGR